MKKLKEILKLETDTKNVVEYDCSTKPQTEQKIIDIEPLVYIHQNIITGIVM